MWKALSSLLDRPRRRQHGTHSPTITQREDYIIPPFISSSIASSENHSSSPTVMTPTTTLLFGLCQRWAWSAVSFRCHTNPEELSSQMRNRNGDTALHVALIGKPPVEPVQALLQICPELVRVRNRQGEYALHVACSYRVSSNVVRVILQAYPAAAAQPNGNGLYPLHLLCDHGCDVDSIQALLETPQGMSTLNVRDRIFQRPPLLLLNLRKNMGQFQEQLATMRDARARQRGMQQQQQLPLSRQDLTMDSEYQRLESMVTACRGVFWDKAALLLLAEYYQMPLVSSSLVNRRLVLHASVASRWCPPSLLEYAVLLHPDLLLERDPDGRVPLHLAARVGNATVLHDVLHANQEAAACRDNTGASPLSLAVQQATLKWSDGLGQLVEANVTALADLKGVERVVPELWSLLERRDVLFQAIRVHATMMGSY